MKLFPEFQSRLAGVLRLLMPAGLLAFTVPASAGILEPDAVFYGNIIISNNLVTAARTDLTVEARRAPAGQLLASYQLGSSARAGDFYTLRVRLETSPLAQPDTMQVGEAVYLALKSGSTTLAQAVAPITDRGQIQRVDFVFASTDPGGNGLPDAWELSQFGSLGVNPSSLGANGLSLLDNYIAGTNPNDAGSYFAVSMTLSNNVPYVFIDALAAGGPGYEGLVRLYSLEYSATPGGGTWLGVENFTNIVGNNQTIAYEVPTAGPLLFYRGKVRLQAQ